MDLKAYLEITAKLFAVLTEACKLLVIAVLSTFAVAAIAQPAWARQRLTEMGLSVKEINIFGVKLASNEAFDMAKTLAEVKSTVTLAQAQIDSNPGNATKDSLAHAVAQLDKLQASLVKQNQTLADVREKAGALSPQVPQSGWLYVGRVGENNSFLPGLSINSKQTRIIAGKLVELHLKSDAVILGNGDECIRTAMDDIHPPTQEEKESIEFLLSPNPKTPLEVLTTAECPSKGGGKWLYAKVRLSKEDVKFMKFGDLLKR